MCVLWCQSPSRVVLWAQCDLTPGELVLRCHCPLHQLGFNQPGAKAISVFGVVLQENPQPLKTSHIQNLLWSTKYSLSSRCKVGEVIRIGCMLFFFRTRESVYTL